MLYSAKVDDVAKPVSVQKEKKPISEKRAAALAKAQEARKSKIEERKVSGEPVPKRQRKIKEPAAPISPPPSAPSETSEPPAPEIKTEPIASTKPEIVEDKTPVKMMSISDGQQIPADTVIDIGSKSK